MNRKVLWISISYAWTEVGLENDEFLKYATRINAQPEDIGLIKKEYLFVILPAFATEAMCAFLSMGMTLPDWGFREGYVVGKIKKWHRKPTYKKALNPLWIVAYPIAFLFSFSHYLKIRSAIIKLQQVDT